MPNQFKYKISLNIVEKAPDNKLIDMEYGKVFLVHNGDGNVFVACNCRENEYAHAARVNALTGKLEMNLNRATHPPQKPSELVVVKSLSDNEYVIPDYTKEIRLGDAFENPNNGDIFYVCDSFIGRPASGTIAIWKQVDSSPYSVVTDLGYVKTGKKYLGRVDINEPGWKREEIQKD